MTNADNYPCALLSWSGSMFRIPDARFGNAHTTPVPFLNRTDIEAVKKTNKLWETTRGALGHFRIVL